jgi:hypothetical protein
VEKGIISGCQASWNILQHPKDYDNNENELLMHIENVEYISRVLSLFPRWDGIASKEQK